MCSTPLCDGVEQLTQCGSRLNPGSLLLQVHLNRSEVEHVEEEKGCLRDVGQTLVVVAPTPDPYWDSDFFGPRDCPLDVGGVQGGDDEEGSGGGGGCEPEVPNVGVEDGGVRRVLWGVEYG
uniref:Uncharacterized protein n=1 Tax=Opuntia streptacantha TaxID=393608 RepID=A0A7C9EI49_OPUST